MKRQTQLKTNNTEEVLDGLGITVVQAGDREIACKCPFHADSHPSFSMNAKNGLWICYQCGASGTLDMLIEKLTGKRGSEAGLRHVKHMQRAKFRPASRKGAEDAIKQSEKLYIEPMDPYYLYAKYSSFKEPPDWALEERNISREAAQAFGIHWRKGWIIPIWAPRRVKDITMDFWGWQFKREDVVNNYPPGIKKSQTLFGMNLLKRTRYTVLVESPLDVVRMSMVGIPAIASYGAMVSRYQVELMVTKLEKIVLALDNDKAGREQMDKIYPTLYRRLPTIRPVFPEGCKDPGDFTDEQLIEVFGATARS